MTVICKAFHCTPLADGQIKLDIEQPETTIGALDPNGSRLLYVPDVAKIMRKNADTIYKMGVRKKNPIPFIRGNGRPYVVEATLARFLSGDLSIRRRPII